MKNKQYNSKKGKTDKLIKDIFRDKQLYLFLVLPVVYIIIFVFFATPNYQKMQNAFPKVAAGNSSFLHVPPAQSLRQRNVVADILLFLVTDM